jgi:GNAT superfamily N-acetyltransferase
MIGGGGDQRQQLLAGLLGGLALLDSLLDELLGIGLALGGGFHVAVDQHHRNAGLGRHIGNACAHEAGADNADLAELGRLDALGAARALVDLLQRDEQ